MLIRRSPDLTYADVTPKSVYTNRRTFLRTMGIAGTAAVAGATWWKLAMPVEEVYATSKLDIAAKSPFSTSEKETPYNDVTHYNNFYEFGTDKTDPAKNAGANHDVRESSDSIGAASRARAGGHQTSGVVRQDKP